MSETQIAEYRPTEAALAELRKQYMGASFDVTTKEGMAGARDARGELRTWRTDLEKERKRIKAPALERSRAIDSEAKRITAELKALEDPIDAQIKEETGRKERERLAAEQAEDERLEKIKTRIADLERWPLAMVGCDAEKIAAAVRALEAIEIGPDGFAEFEEQARTIHAESLRKVTELHESTLKTEADRAEIAKLRTEQDERAREEQARIAADVKARAEAEAESRRKIEESERASRMKIEAEQRAARERVEKEEAEARALKIAEETKARAERERLAEIERKAAREAEEEDRERRRKEAIKADAHGLLNTFVERYGDHQEYDAITDAINEYMEGQS